MVGKKTLESACFESHNKSHEGSIASFLDDYASDANRKEEEETRNSDMTFNGNVNENSGCHELPLSPHIVSPQPQLLPPSPPLPPPPPLPQEAPPPPPLPPQITKLSSYSKEPSPLNPVVSQSPGTSPSTLEGGINDFALFESNNLLDKAPIVSDSKSNEDGTLEETKDTDCNFVIDFEEMLHDDKRHKEKEVEEQGHEKSNDFAFFETDNLPGQGPLIVPVSDNTDKDESLLERAAHKEMDVMVTATNFDELFQTDGYHEEEEDNEKKNDFAIFEAKSFQNQQPIVPVSGNSDSKVNELLKFGEDLSEDNKSNYVTILKPSENIDNGNDDGCDSEDGNSDDPEDDSIEDKKEDDRKDEIDATVDVAVDEDDNCISIVGNSAPKSGSIRAFNPNVIDMKFKRPNTSSSHRSQNTSIPKSISTDSVSSSSATDNNTNRRRTTKVAGINIGKAGTGIAKVSVKAGTGIARASVKAGTGIARVSVKAGAKAGTGIAKIAKNIGDRRLRALNSVQPGAVTKRDLQKIAEEVTNDSKMRRMRSTISMNNKKFNLKLKDRMNKLSTAVLTPRASINKMIDPEEGDNNLGFYRNVR